MKKDKHVKNLEKIEESLREKALTMRDEELRVAFDFHADGLEKIADDVAKEIKRYVTIGGGGTGED